MHKVLLTHQIVPGKFSELSDWFKEADEKRKADDPDYKPPRRYIYQTGSGARQKFRDKYENSIKELTTHVGEVVLKK